MGRMVRVLLKIPAVRRVMVRLANAEAAVAEQQGQVGAVSSTLTGHHVQLTGLREGLDGLGNHVERLATGQSDDRAILDGARARTESLMDRIEQLTAGQAEIAQHMPPDRRTALEAQVHALNTMITEITQHLPADRANLQAMLHGHQAQLNALNSALQANQSQLSAMNDAVERLSRQLADAPPKVVRFEPAARAPYTFEQLLNRQGLDSDVDLVFHIHVPKAGGKTIAALLRQNDFLALDFDMNHGSFFQVALEDSFFDNYCASPPRRAYALTGHFRLDQPILQRAWMPHAIMTTLRNPVERMLSYYNYTLRIPDNPWHAEVTQGMSFIEYTRKAVSAFGPQYSFFDDTGQGTFAPSGTATAQQCFDNLITKVGLYGLTERFDEFVVLLGYLLGRSGIVLQARNVTSEIPNPSGLPSKMSVSESEREELSGLLKDDIWFYDEAVKEYHRRVSDQRVQRLFAEALPLLRAARESADRITALRDPGDPTRRAFDAS